ncbi:MAG: sigma-70 family RNA polymerase sigma factor [Ruminococcus sp.]|jgi:RNA polymerase sigma factor (sigma-70 family)|nr:sigma-70 family RNA polymerase sigma factor [Ruminococcus sp.]
MKDEQTRAVRLDVRTVGITVGREYGRKIHTMDAQLIDKLNLSPPELGESNQNERKKQVAKIYKIIFSELTPSQKEIFLLRYEQNLKQWEIAEKLGINKSTVSRTLKRASDNIKKYVKYYYD